MLYIISLALIVVIIYIASDPTANYENSKSPTDRHEKISTSEIEEMLAFYDSTQKKSEPKWLNKEDYMKSTEWNNKRLKRLQIDNNTCTICGDKETPLEIHHITYSNLYNENIDDLRAVCRSCHQKIHNLYGYKGNYFPLIKD